MEEVRVGLGDRSYDIVIDSGIIDRVGRGAVGVVDAGRFFIIADDRVAGLYGDRLLASFEAAGVRAELIGFPSGEESKNLATIASLAGELARRGADRKSCLVALGGGVTGDITGFLAACYMRGIDFIQVPTSLLAQVDSSVGGKTGVDIPEGKNLVGSFHQPRAVFIDPLALASLPEGELLNGLAEVIKYGVIRDRDLFDTLGRQRRRILALDPGALVPVVRRCCEIKAEVVAADEREGGLRRILNFGHTIGHAVEAASDFAVPHGGAVAMGMVAAAGIAAAAGLMSRQEAGAVRDLVAAFGLPVDIPADLDRGEIKRYLLTDKKTVGGRVFFVLPRRVGEVFVTPDVDGDLIDAALGIG